MSYQITSLGETLPARPTYIRTFTGMCEHMILKILFLLESPWTHFALKIASFTVNTPQVNPQIPFFRLFFVFVCVCCPRWHKKIIIGFLLCVCVKQVGWSFGLFVAKSLWCGFFLLRCVCVLWVIQKKQITFLHFSVNRCGHFGHG